MTVVFFYLVLILHFCCFQSFKELVSFLPKRTAKLRHFFELTKYFKKNIYFFFSNVCFLNSQATSLDCGCKVTAFSETTKIFLRFFWKFFITRYLWERKIFILPWILCFFSLLGRFFRLFYSAKICWITYFFRVFVFFCVFIGKIEIFIFIKNIGYFS